MAARLGRHRMYTSIAPLPSPLQCSLMGKGCPKVQAQQIRVFLPSTTAAQEERSSLYSRQVKGVAASPTKRTLRKPPPLVPAPLPGGDGVFPVAPAHPKSRTLPHCSTLGRGQLPTLSASSPQHCALKMPPKLLPGRRCRDYPSPIAALGEGEAAPHSVTPAQIHTSAAAAIFGEPHNGRDAAVDP